MASLGFDLHPGPYPRLDGSSPGLDGSSRERKRRETHERLFASALEEIQRVGLESARVEHICNRAGVTRPTFYAHFQSKEGVLEELQLRIFGSMLERMERRVEATSTISELIDALACGVFEEAGKQPEALRREVSSFSARHQSQPEWVGYPLFQTVERRFAQVQRDGGFVEPSPTELTHWVMVVLNGFYLSYPDRLEEGLRGARAALRMLISGLMGTAASRPA